MVEARNSDGNIKNDPIAEVQSHKSWLVIIVYIIHSSVSKMQLVWHAELFLCLSTSEGRFFVLLHEGTLVMSYFPKQNCSYYYVLPYVILGHTVLRSVSVACTFHVATVTISLLHILEK